MTETPEKEPTPEEIAEKIVWDWFGFIPQTHLPSLPDIVATAIRDGEQRGREEMRALCEEVASVEFEKHGVYYTLVEPVDWGEKMAAEHILAAIRALSTENESDAPVPASSNGE